MELAFVDNYPVPYILPPIAQTLLSGRKIQNEAGDVFLPDSDGNIVLHPGEKYFTIEEATAKRVVGPAERTIGKRTNSLLRCVHALHREETVTLRPTLILDSVYEHISLPAAVFAVIDTPEVQRLRSLKQLGSTVFLYPGATHSRFEHSVGVAHLAGLMARKLAERQPELGITESDIICCSIAGACHDLGHGPFSHLFEDIVNRIREEQFPREDQQKKWKHEEMSVTLMRRALNRLKLEQYQICEEDINLIELMILGLAPDSPWPSNVGRLDGKRFLIDIVNNKRNGIDVDKLDYFLRDSLYCFGRSTVDCHIARLLDSCRAILHNGEVQICFEEKMALSLCDIFALRAKMHKYAYQHRICRAVDHMHSDILSLAEPFFTVAGTGGKAVRISECIDDIDGFCKLGDWIISAMAASMNPRLKPAQEIIARLNRRDLYAVAGIAMFDQYQKMDNAAAFKHQILQFVPENDFEEVERNLIVDFIRITFGSTDDHGNPDDPISHVSFFNPRATTVTPHRLPPSHFSPLFSPTEFGETSIIVLVRNHECLPTVISAFLQWEESQSKALRFDVPTFNMSPTRSNRKRHRPERETENAAF